MTIAPIPLTTESQTTVNTTAVPVAKWLPGDASHWIHFFSEAVSGEFALSALGWLWLEAIRRKTHHRRTENIFTVDQLPVGWKRFPTMATSAWLSTCEEISVQCFVKTPGVLTTLPRLQPYPLICPARMSKFFGFEEPEGNVWLAKRGHSFVQLSDTEPSGWGILLLSAQENKETARLIRQLAQIVTVNNLPCSIPVTALRQYAETRSDSWGRTSDSKSFLFLKRRLFNLRIKTQLLVFSLVSYRTYVENRSEALISMTDTDSLNS